MSETNTPILIKVDFDKTTGLYSLRSSSVELPKDAIIPSATPDAIATQLGRYYPDQNVMFHKSSDLPELDL